MGKSVVTLTHKGNFNNLERFLRRAVRLNAVTRMILNRYGNKGVEALKAATPKDTGKTAESWRYEIEEDANGMKIVWKNDNVHDGVLIAVLLQYGHATKNGGWVEGTDYINPAIKSIFQQMADEAWKEVRGK